MISHDEARALISARLDRPLDPASDAQLAQHLQGCAACQRFAARMAAMQTGIRELPYIPPSPKVRAAVMAEVRRGRRPGGRFAAWLGRFSLSPGPIATVGAVAVIALVLVATLLASDLLPGNDSSDGGGTRVAFEGATEATRAAATEAETRGETVSASAPPAAPVATSTPPPNVQGNGATEPVPPIAPSTTPAPGEVGLTMPSVTVPAPPAPTALAATAPIPAATEPATTGPVATEAVPPAIEPAPSATDDVDVALAREETATAETGDAPSPTAATATSAATSAPPADGSVAPSPSPSAERGVAAISTETPTVTPEATDEPTATATDEPTGTPEPTLEPTATATATIEPTATATIEPTATSDPTATLEPTVTPTEEPTATVEPTVEPTATEPPRQTGINPTDDVTPIPAGSADATATAGAVASEAGDDDGGPGNGDDGTDDGSAEIATATAQAIEAVEMELTATAEAPEPSERGGITTTDGVTPIPADGEPTAPTGPDIADATETPDPAARPIGDEPTGEPTDDARITRTGEPTADATEETVGEPTGAADDETDQTTGEPTGEPAAFAIDDAPVEASVSLGAAPPGPLRISPDGGLFITSDGGDTIGVAAFIGGETRLGTFYYPVWTGQGQILVTYYTPDSGSAVVGLISSDGSVTPVTTPDPDDPGRRDIPAGESDGALYYQRNWPDEPGRGIEFHRVSGGTDETIWSSTDLIVTSRHPDQTPDGDAFLIATSGGWYRIDTGGGATPLGGSVTGEPSGIAFGPGGQTAVLGGGVVSLGTVDAPGGGGTIAGVGDGAGVAWSPDGSRIAVATGSTVTVYDASGNQLAAFTSDTGNGLSGPTWQGSDLLVIRGGGDPGLIRIPAADLP